MGTIRSMSEEIKYQIDDLPAFNEHLRSLDAPPQSEIGGNNCVFGEVLVPIRRLNTTRNIRERPIAVIERYEKESDKKIFFVDVTEKKNRPFRHGID